ncbi:hypothetical protein C1H46_036816 [Malus baccata]|uniref:Uncharacterized protein n=1 Tax=Malus baccata TaxID=106549 RepID=A0A540KTU9_MALBA|nr:hypothetical protein C1H46_036816 [Malus baccata]
MRWKSWKAMPEKNVKANKINREKKTLLHHSSSRPFSYRMEVWQQRSTSLQTFMFDPRMSWLSPFMSPSPSFFLRLRSSLWIPPRMRGFRSLQTPWIRLSGGGRGRIVGGWGMPGGKNLESLFILAVEGEVTSLTAKVADLRTELASYKSHMSLIV